MQYIPLHYNTLHYIISFVPRCYVLLHPFMLRTSAFRYITLCSACVAIMCCAILHYIVTDIVLVCDSVLEALMRKCRVVLRRRSMFASQAKSALRSLGREDQ